MVGEAKITKIIEESEENQHLSLEINKNEENTEIRRIGVSDENSYLEADYENMSVEEILKRNKVLIYNNNDTQPLFDHEVINNKYFKLYFAKNSTLQNCSLMVLNDVNKKKKIFGELVENVVRLDSINSNFVLKLKGANIFPNKVFFLFDLVLTNYLSKKKQFEHSNNFKFCVMFYLIEMLSVLHEEMITIEDLRFSLLLLDNMDELKFMVPFGKY